MDPLPPVAAGSDSIDDALTEALRAATAAGRFDVVAQLARELEARRLGRAENVVQFDARRAKRGGV